LIRCTLSLLSCGLALATAVAAADLSGEIAVESRLFPHDALDARQQDTGFSIALEPEFYHDWSAGSERFVVVPYVRWDLDDSRRTHADIRELYWRRSFDSADLFVGIRKIFWGVTESVHLVDVINQTDLVDNADTEDKLGQPMVQLTLLRDWGTVDLYLMSGFRQRTFAGGDGRLRPPLRVTHTARYEADLDRWHPDVAGRWSQVLGDYDVGVAHFYGTSREPRLVLDVVDSGARLVPHYDLLQQTSLDVQFTRNDWLVKLEAIHRDGVDGRSSAVVSGVEYSLFAIFSTAIDLGLVAEVQYDSRDTPFARLSDNDIALGGRFTLNDVQDTAVLAFTAFDMDNGSRFTSVEADRRWQSAGKLRLEARFFSNVETGDPLYLLRRDDHLQLEYVHFF
jgi:hypothetical protein